VRNAACRFIRSRSSVGRFEHGARYDFSGVDAIKEELELLKERGERVGVLDEMQNRSSRLRAPLVGVSIDEGELSVTTCCCGV